MKDLKFLKQNIIAHRGVHNQEKGIIENTLEAFQKAIEKNYNIELDLHCTKDGEVIVFHDDNLKRITGMDKDVKDATFEEIQELSIIPRFSDVLKLVDGKVPILIELKTDNKVGILESKTMELLKNYKGKYAIQSFNPFSIMWLKNNFPNVVRGQLVSKFENEKMNTIKKWLLKNMVFNFLAKPDFISYHIDDLSYQEILSIKKKRLILGWTVRTKEKYEELNSYYDNLICENFI